MFIYCHWCHSVTGVTPVILSLGDERGEPRVPGLHESLLERVRKRVTGECHGCHSPCHWGVPGVTGRVTESDTPLSLSRHEQGHQSDSTTLITVTEVSCLARAYGSNRECHE
jgi:hypothetical protein